MPAPPTSAAIWISSATSCSIRAWCSSSRPARPEQALPAAFLIFSFVGTGSSFLAYAIFAAKRGITTNIRGAKSLYYIGGLTEGTETIALFVALCLFPDAFPWLAWGFGGLCWITTAARVTAAAGTFRSDQP